MKHGLAPFSEIIYSFLLPLVRDSEESSKHENLIINTINVFSQIDQDNSERQLEGFFCNLLLKIGNEFQLNNFIQDIDYFNLTLVSQDAPLICLVWLLLALQFNIQSIIKKLILKYNISYKTIFILVDISFGIEKNIILRDSNIYLSKQIIDRFSTHFQVENYLNKAKSAVFSVLVDIWKDYKQFPLFETQHFNVTTSLSRCINYNNLYSLDINTLELSLVITEKLSSPIQFIRLDAALIGQLIINSIDSKADESLLDIITQKNQHVKYSLYDRKWESINSINKNKIHSNKDTSTILSNCEKLIQPINSIKQESLCNYVQEYPLNLLQAKEWLNHEISYIDGGLELGNKPTQPTSRTLSIQFQIDKRDLALKNLPLLIQQAKTECSNNNNYKLAYTHICKDIIDVLFSMEIENKQDLENCLIACVDFNIDQNYYYLVNKLDNIENVARKIKLLCYISSIIMHLKFRSIDISSELKMVSLTVNKKHNSFKGNVNRFDSFALFTTLVLNKQINKHIKEFEKNLDPENEACLAVEKNYIFLLIKTMKQIFYNISNFFLEMDQIVSIYKQSVDMIRQSNMVEASYISEMDISTVF